MAFKRTHYRADWASNVTTTQKQDFIDNFFSDCARSGLDGLIVANEGGGHFILEGDGARVDTANSDLDSASELTNGGVYLTETSGTTFTCLTSHMHSDNRDTT